MKKRTIKKGYLIAAVAVLAVIAGVCAFINAQENPQNADGLSLTISRDGEELAVYTLDEIKAMPAVSKEAHLSSGSQADEDGVYTGVPLSDILEMTDPALLTECTRFIAKAGDAFTSVLSKEDLENSKNVLVVYQKDGEDLTPLPEGGTGPMRIMVVGDIYGYRSTQFLVEVDCN